MGKGGFNKLFSRGNVTRAVDVNVNSVESQKQTEKQSFTGRLGFAVTAAALGSAFQHGYNTGVVNAPQQLIERWIATVLADRTGEVASKAQVTVIWSIAVAIFCVGGMIGGALTSVVAERFGRRGGLLINNSFVFVSAIFQGCAQRAGSFEMIILGRLLIGVNCGLNAGLTPMYLAEISPTNLRGAIGTSYQLIVTISILVSQILGMESVLGNAHQWPTLLSLIAVAGVLQLLMLPFCPESPKYLLVNRGNEPDATRALKWLRGTDDVQQEMSGMIQNDAQDSRTVSLRELLTSPALRAPLIVAIMVMLCQQLSGINAIMFFSTKIFKMANLDDMNAQYATLGMGAINVLMTLVSLVLVEVAGRKTLLMVGLVGMTVDTLLLAIALHYVESVTWLSYISIGLVLLYVVLFAAGLGSIPWFLVSELFAQSARPPATALAVSINWSANFLVGVGFLPIQEVIGGWVFIIFAVLLALFSWFVWKKVPETKNRTSDEIAAIFRQQSYEA